ncbi:T9SS type A sorting domain-containing protein [Aquimarina agarivorans]|uniref:T9SS type A sorting domain-containing protein n=1 Tax=Aquimarina agarivorans TaxID=980584 RepID=UPI000248FCA3|nr:T9SS type A sorting domain-containing protein [Aquimarina agarivorans]
MKTKFILNALFLLLFSTTNLLAQKYNPRHPGWTDSYAKNGFCWCNTTFDHDLGDINKVSFVINGKKRNIRDVCNELKKHPLYKKYVNGDAPYNDIQCGNGPANTAPDETGCPGRTDIGPNGCNQKGPKWDVAWLKSRKRFGGNNNSNPDAGNANGAPVGSIISLQKSGGNKNYVTADISGANNSVIARANRVDAWERFLVENNPKGGAALKALSNNNYLQSVGNNTGIGIRAAGKNKGDWERFEWKSKGNGKVALRSLQTGKWLQAKWNVNRAIIFPIGNNDGNQETFDWKVTSGQKLISQNEFNGNFRAVQNNITNNDLFLEVVSNKIDASKISVYDLSGKLVYTFNYSLIDGVNSIDLGTIKSGLSTKGIYLLNFKSSDSNYTQKIIIN